MPIVLSIALRNLREHGFTPHPLRKLSFERSFSLEREVKPDSSAILDFNLGSIYFQQDQLDKLLPCMWKQIRRYLKIAAS